LIQDYASGTEGYISRNHNIDFNVKKSIKTRFNPKDKEKYKKIRQ
jgi:hypothetical protein